MTSASADDVRERYLVVNRRIAPEEIKVSENPSETGSFYIGFQFARDVMFPDGKIRSNGL